MEGGKKGKRKFGRRKERENEVWKEERKGKGSLEGGKKGKMKFGRRKEREKEVWKEERKGKGSLEGGNKGKRKFGRGEVREIGSLQIQIKLRSALFVTYTTIQSIMRSEMCSLHLTLGSHFNPFNPTPGRVKCRWVKCSGAVRHCGVGGGSVPCSRVSPQSWTLPAGIRTHNIGLPRVSSPTLYPLAFERKKEVWKEDEEERKKGKKRKFERRKKSLNYILKKKEVGLES